jgi:hypothetical protein
MAAKSLCYAGRAYFSDARDQRSHGLQQPCPHAPPAAARALTDLCFASSCHRISRDCLSLGKCWCSQQDFHGAGPDLPNPRTEFLKNPHAELSNPKTGDGNRGNQ